MSRKKLAAVMSARREVRRWLKKIRPSPGMIRTVLERMEKGASFKAATKDLFKDPARYRIRLLEQLDREGLI